MTNQAARMFAMKRSSSSRSRVLSLDRRARRVQHFLRCGTGFGRAAIDFHDVGGGIVGALRDGLNAARDFLGRRTLLLVRHWRSSMRWSRSADGAADLLDGGDRFLRRSLHAGDVHRYLVGRLRGLAGERFDLGGDDGEAAAGLAGAGRFDGGVQRQQIGLLGDRGDQLDHVADLLRGARQFADPPVGLLGLNARRLPRSGWIP